MSHEIIAAFNDEMQQTIEQFRLSNFDTAYVHAERAHILGQRFFVAHWRSHFWMLRIALATSDSNETIGQIVRLFAVILGFVFGWVPVGNTGRANVAATSPMPLPNDLRPYYDGYNLKKK